MKKLMICGAALFVGIGPGIGRVIAQDKNVDSKDSGKKRRVFNIPLRDPKVGEGRSGWWWSCWAGHIVVIQGTLSLDHIDPPDLKLKMSPQALKKYFPDKNDQELFESFSGYCIAEIDVERLLFAAPGITVGDGNVAGMKSGKVKKVKALVPILEADGEEPDVSLVPRYHPFQPIKIKSVFVFRYDIGFVIQMPLVLSDQLSEEDIEPAKEIFAYREKFNQHKE